MNYVHFLFDFLHEFDSTFLSSLHFIVLLLILLNISSNLNMLLPSLASFQWFSLYLSIFLDADQVFNGGWISWRCSQGWRHILSTSVVLPWHFGGDGSSRISIGTEYECRCVDIIGMDCYFSEYSHHTVVQLRDYFQFMVKETVIVHDQANAINLWMRWVHDMSEIRSEFEEIFF